MSPEIMIVVVAVCWAVLTIIVALIVWSIAYKKASEKFYATKCRDCRFPFMSQKFYEASCKWDEFKMEFIATWCDWFPTVPMSDMYQALRHVTNELERLRKGAPIEQPCTCVWHGKVTPHSVVPITEWPCALIEINPDCTQHKELGRL